MPETFKSIRAAFAQIKRDNKKLEKAVGRGIKKAARAGVSIVRKNVPVAFGELRDSIAWDDIRQGRAQVVADAPHAASVEWGSRPHTPPLAPLIAWVKLRGAQGIGTNRRIRKADKPTAKRVAQQLAAMAEDYSSGNSSDINSPVALARAIQRAISVNGTKPHNYMRNSVPAISVLMWDMIAEEMAKADKSAEF